MLTESSTFIDDVFEHRSQSYDTTSFVLNRDSPGGLVRWSAFLLHNTNQFFIKVRARKLVFLIDDIGIGLKFL